MFTRKSERTDQNTRAILQQKDVLNTTLMLLATLVLLLIIAISNYNIKATEKLPNTKPNLPSSASQIKESLNSIGKLLTLINKNKKQAQEMMKAA